MPRGIHPGHVAAFFAAFSGSGILLVTVHHSYLVFYWKWCCIPIWYFIGNRAASFGILFGNRAASLYGSHLSGQGTQAIKTLELNKAIER